MHAINFRLAQLIMLTDHTFVSLTVSQTFSDQLYIVHSTCVHACSMYSTTYALLVQHGVPRHVAITLRDISVNYVSDNGAELS